MICSVGGGDLAPPRTETLLSPLVLGVHHFLTARMCADSSAAAAAQFMRSSVGYSPLRTSSADTGQFHEPIAEEPFARCASSEADEKEGSKRSWIGKKADDVADVFGEVKLERQHMMAEYGRTRGRGGRRGSMPVVSAMYKDDEKEEEMKETMLRLK